MSDRNASPETESHVRVLPGPWPVVARILLAAIPLFGIVYAFKLPSYVGYSMWSEQAALLVLGMGLAASFLLVPARKTETPQGPSALDVGFAALSLIVTLRTTFQYEELVASGFLGTGAAYYVTILSAAATILLILEALRRLTGWIMVVLVAVFLAYAYGANVMPGPFRGNAPETDFLLAYLHLDSAGVLGTALSVVVTTVIAYVLLGVALFRLGGGEMFLNLALAVMGRFSGGSAKSAVMASSMFGAISGSAVANVATTGIVTIPLMKKGGYRPAQAGAVEAVASTGGQLLPPIMGAAAFIMSDFLQVPYTQVALAALLPALIFYFALFMQIHLYAARHGIRPLEPQERPRVKDSLKRHWPFLVPLVLLVYLLFFRGWQPEQAALASLVLVVAAALVVREVPVTLKSLFAVLERAGRSLLEIIVITAAAGLIIGVLSITGLSFSLGVSIAEASGSNILLLLLVTALTAIVFGMGMPTTAVYVLMATLLAPALVAAGVNAMAAHLFVLYFGVLSMITPPVCLASFTAASLARAPFMRTGCESLRFGAVAFIVPFLFASEPALLLQDASWTQVGQALVTAIIGCLLFAAAIEGYLFDLLTLPLRLLAGLGGLLLLIPASAEYLPMAAGSDQVGFVIGAVVLVVNWWRGRAMRGERRSVSALSPIGKENPTE
ncbi:TRAP transporter fused permease subunit [Telmatospirillum sp. J64-1]|uniref:TRAP transporter permease n=1 Tax=Telmatospirillum sp. J64-1 TaxID=2502183 RepID=UPI00115EB4C9|nr:TRAP transporter fused permease subunit [Telmatospirillum sp. J64-1]